MAFGTMTRLVSPLLERRRWWWLSERRQDYHRFWNMMMTMMMAFGTTKDYHRSWNNDHEETISAFGMMTTTTITAFGMTMRRLLHARANHQRIWRPHGALETMRLSLLWNNDASNDKTITAFGMTMTRTTRDMTRRNENDNAWNIFKINSVLWDSKWRWHEPPPL